MEDVFKEMAEQEALERGMFDTSNSITVDNLFCTARQLSLKANEPNTNNRGQSSRSKCLKIEPITVLSVSEIFSLATLEDLAWSETPASPMQEVFDGTCNIR